jgi:hypothetical protein
MWNVMALTMFRLFRTMRRVSIAVAWIFLSTIPAVVMSVFLFGCCVLPFHRVIHRVFPACHGIVKMLAHEAQPNATPAKIRAKQTIGTASMTRAAAALAVGVEPLRSRALIRLRDRFSLGAMRCDTDVGLHLLLTVLLV